MSFPKGVCFFIYFLWALLTSATRMSSFRQNQGGRVAFHWGIMIVLQLYFKGGLQRMLIYNWGAQYLHLHICQYSDWLPFLADWMFVRDCA